MTGTTGFRIWHLSDCWDSFSSVLPRREQKCPEGQGFPQGRLVVLGLRDVASRVLFLCETASIHLVIEKNGSKTLLTGILGPHAPCMCLVTASWLWQRPGTDRALLHPLTASFRLMQEPQQYSALNGC